MSRLYRRKLRLQALHHRRFGSVLSRDTERATTYSGIGTIAETIEFQAAAGNANG